MIATKVSFLQRSGPEAGIASANSALAPYSMHSNSALVICREVDESPAWNKAINGDDFLS